MGGAGDFGRFGEDMVVSLEGDREVSEGVARCEVPARTALSLVACKLLAGEQDD